MSNKQQINRQQESIGILIILLVVSGAIVYIQQMQQDSLSDQLGELKDKTEQLETILSDIQKMVKTYDIEASFVADKGIAIPGDAVTFLSGYMQLKNITHIPQSQLKISVYYNLIETSNSTSGVISYDYDTYKEVYLNTSDYKQIMIPWGAFPIKLNGFTQGEQIFLTLDAHIVITSDYLPPGTYVAETTVSHKFKLVIQK